MKRVEERHERAQLNLKDAHDANSPLSLFQKMNKKLNKNHDNDHLNPNSKNGTNQHWNSVFFLPLALMF